MRSAEGAHFWKPWVGSSAPKEEKEGKKEKKRGKNMGKKKENGLVKNWENSGAPNGRFRPHGLARGHPWNFLFAGVKVESSTR